MTIYSLTVVMCQYYQDKLMVYLVVLPGIGYIPVRLEPAISAYLPITPMAV